MFLLALFLVNACIYFLFVIYCRLTWGINKCSRHLVGKVVIVTGGNNGIGFEAAKDLAERGAKVILACRNADRGTRARDKIIKETENKEVYFKPLDLASFKSVKAFAEDILKNEKRLDILINNAGMFGSGHSTTEDGLLLDMQTNHFGPFLLTSLLLPLLKSSAPSRIVNVSSMAYSFADLDLDNLNFDHGKYSPYKVYGATKLCNVLMTVELAERLKGTGVTVNSLHPGVIYTDIALNVPLAKYAFILFRPFYKTPWQGAQTTTYLAVSPEVQNVSGKYFVDCREKPTTELAGNSETARKLWEISEKLVHIKQ
ncbi:retinol dehydrogenase 14-like [Ostrinia nubilalis]|uniref:retinol dehydrogenase 14-like n=1 Tax=Ostrinia nubilalis TaxID=29057 RepID=UPI00308230A1